MLNKNQNQLSDNKSNVKKTTQLKRKTVDSNESNTSKKYDDNKKRKTNNSGIKPSSSTQPPKQQEHAMESKNLYPSFNINKTTNNNVFPSIGNCGKELSPLNPHTSTPTKIIDKSHEPLLSKQTVLSKYRTPRAYFDLFGVEYEHSLHPDEGTKCRKDFCKMVDNIEKAEKSGSMFDCTRLIKKAYKAMPIHKNRKTGKKSSYINAIHLFALAACGLQLEDSNLWYGSWSNTRNVAETLNNKVSGKVSEGTSTMLIYLKLCVKFASFSSYTRRQRKNTHAAKYYKNIFLNIKNITELLPKETVSEVEGPQSVIHKNIREFVQQFEKSFPDPDKLKENTPPKTTPNQRRPLWKKLQSIDSDLQNLISSLSATSKTTQKIPNIKDTNNSETTTSISGNVTNNVVINNIANNALNILNSPNTPSNSNVNNVLIPSNYPKQYAPQFPSSKNNNQPHLLPSVKELNLPTPGEFTNFSSTNDNFHENSNNYYTLGNFNVDMFFSFTPSTDGTSTNAPVKNTEISLPPQ